MDSGASHHVTRDLQNLSMYSDYDVGDELLVGNGTGLTIANSGSITLATKSKPLQLNNVLHVPAIRNNLISISKLYQNNLVTIEFFDTFFL